MNIKVVQMNIKSANELKNSSNEKMTKNSLNEQKIVQINKNSSNEHKNSSDEIV